MGALKNLGSWDRENFIKMAEPVVEQTTDILIKNHYWAVARYSDRIFDDREAYVLSGLGEDKDVLGHVYYDEGCSSIVLDATMWNKRRDTPLASRLKVKLSEIKNGAIEPWLGQI